MRVNDQTCRVRFYLLPVVRVNDAHLYAVGPFSHFWQVKVVASG